MDEQLGAVNTIDLSVVVPVYNRAANVPEFLRRLATGALVLELGFRWPVSLKPARPFLLVEAKPQA